VADTALASESSPQCLYIPFICYEPALVACVVNNEGHVINSPNNR